MRSMQVTTAHLLTAVAANAQYAEALGLIGGHHDELVGELQLFLEARAPKFTRATLPVSSRGLAKIRRKITAGESLPSVLATDIRYNYLLELLKRAGFSSCFPEERQLIEQHTDQRVRRTSATTDFGES